MSARFIGPHTQTPDVCTVDEPCFDCRLILRDAGWRRE